MPFISFSTGQKLEETKKEELKSMFGKNVTLLSGKSEARLMIDLCDEHTMYFAGNQNQNLAFIDVKLFQMSSYADKKAFTDAVFADVKNICGISEQDIYLNFVQLDTWGTGGTLK